MVKTRKAKTKRQIPKVKVSELLDKPYQDELETSQITGKAVATLRNDRHLRRGIPYLKVGIRSIRYRTRDITEYMERRLINPEHEREA